MRPLNEEVCHAVSLAAARLSTRVFCVRCCCCCCVRGGYSSSIGKSGRRASPRDKDGPRRGPRDNGRFFCVFCRVNAG